MKIGILGAGRIAGIMAETIRGMEEAGMGAVELYAVGARELSRARAFAEREGVKKAYGSYEELLSDPELELVYIATPHSHHYEHIKLCLEHGKHVLCEKAFTANANQAQELLDIARKKGLLLTEAIWTRYQPMRKIIRELVDSAVSGKPRTLTANLSYAISEKERIMAPELAGGALLDVGVYTLNFAEMVFGRAEKVQAVCTMTETGVDETDCIFLSWADGRAAVLNSGIMAISDRRGIIYCTDGYIEVENINNPQSVRAYNANRELIRELHCPEQITGYEYEVLEAVETIRKGGTECPSMPHEETLHIMSLMDEIRGQLGLRYPFE